MVLHIVRARGYFLLAVRGDLDFFLLHFRNAGGKKLYFAYQAPSTDYLEKGELAESPTAWDQSQNVISLQRYAKNRAPHKCLVSRMYSTHF